jgi:lipopolysaccharide biosynthesis glycosyltransferase
MQYRNANTYITISSYNRLLIPQLKPDIDKAIYFDVDVICLKDCAELYSIDMHNYALAAAPDYMPEYLVKNLRKELHWSAEHQYFNAGVLILDLKQWREKNITAALFEIEKKYRDNLRNADQDVLNTYFDNNYQQLGTEYNYTTNNLGNIPKQIHIRHFLSAFKPWNSYKYVNKPIINFKEFWFFASLTPFYAGLQMEFLANILQKNSVSIPTLMQKRTILNDIRKNVVVDLKINK